MEGTELGGDQQFCLRWNNFQANITSQFEALRDDEDFVDVTLACEGHRLEAHKVVLSACSPYFKELFKNNPCPHPIIFMRDCEVAHVRALLQFMYAGQVNIAQAQLSAFLRTADALQIRGLTDCSQHNDKKPSRKSPPSQLRNLLSAKPSQSTSSSKATNQNIESTSTDDQEKTVNRRPSRNSPDVARNNLNDEAPIQTSSQMRPNNDEFSETSNYPTIRVKTDLEVSDVKNEESETLMESTESERLDKCHDFNATELLEPKMEVMEQDASDEERSTFPQMYYENNSLANPFAALPGNVDIMAGINADLRDEHIEASGACAGGAGVRCDQCGRRYSNASNLRQHVRLIHEARPVACATCGRSFKTPLYLRRHTLAQHPSPAPSPSPSPRIKPPPLAALHAASAPAPRQ